MYTIYIFGIMTALAVIAGMVLFALAAILVTVRASVEALVDGTAASIRKLASSALHRPKIPAVHTMPYEPTLRR
jgi:hypothetical protein